MSISRLVFATIFHLVTTGVLATQPRIIRQPEDQRVPLNSTVRLACRLSVLPNLSVHWIKNGFAFGHPPHSVQSYNRRYSYPDNVREGQFDLQIRQVHLEDDGKFRCQATAGGGSVLSRLATLYVLVPSRAPFLRQVRPRVRQSTVDMKKRAWVEDGQKLSLECVAQDGRPGASLVWSIDGQPVHPKAEGKFIHGTIMGTIAERNKKSKRLRGLLTRVSKFTATINKLHHDKTITCIAHNEGYANFPQKPARTRLEVRYKPHVLIRVFPHRPNNTYDEFEYINIRCEADGRPNSFHWQWKLIKDGRTKDIDHIVESWYRFRVNRTMHRHTFRCIAMNYAAGQADVTINVKYPPQFTVRHATLYSASIGGQVAMRCDVDSNPKALVEWFKRGESGTLERSPQLVRKNIKQSDFGTYVCKASSGDFSPIQKNVYLELRGRPLIKRNSVSYGIKGRTGKVLCYVTSIPHPKPKDILWFRNGEQITNTGRYSLKQERFLRGVKAYLYITRLSPGDFGTYNCTVTNSVGRDSTLITLVPQDTLSVAFICGASIAVLLALAVVIVILCLCRKNSARRRLYKQAQRQSKNCSPGDGHAGKPVDEQELVFRPSATVAVTSPPILDAPWRNKEHVAGSTALHHPQLAHAAHPVATTASLAHTLGRYEFDERSYLRNGNILRYKGIDLSPPPATIHPTIVEEDEAYKEDSARSYDSGYSPGPGLTNLFNVPISSTVAVSSFAQHGHLLPPLSSSLSYVPVSNPAIAGQRAYSTMPSGGGVVSCHSTNV